MSQPEPNPGVLSEPDPPVRRRNPTLAPFKGFPGGTSSKEPTCQCRRRRKWGFDPWVRKIPCRKKWQPTPVFLPGESHRQRRLEGYKPWGRKESDSTERLTPLSPSPSLLCLPHNRSINPGERYGSQEHDFIWRLTEMSDYCLQVTILSWSECQVLL